MSEELYYCEECDRELPEDEMYCTGDRHDPICNECWDHEMRMRDEAGIIVWYVGSTRHERKRGE